MLGIESSCDDTGVAVLSTTGRVLGETLVSQSEIHAPWGGVVPNLAMEAHKAAMNKAVEDTLRQAGLTANQLHAVAVTQGPGLSLCLRVSSTSAGTPASILMSCMFIVQRRCLAEDSLV